MAATNWMPAMQKSKIIVAAQILSGDEVRSSFSCRFTCPKTPFGVVVLGWRQSSWRSPRTTARVFSLIQSLVSGINPITAVADTSDEIPSATVRTDDSQESIRYPFTRFEHRRGRTWHIYQQYIIFLFIKSIFILVFPASN